MILRILLCTVLIATFLACEIGAFLIALPPKPRAATCLCKGCCCNPCDCECCARREAKSGK